MAIRTIALRPDKASYTQTPGNDVDSVKLDGGSSWYRLDSLGSARTVNVQWTCDADEYKYLMLFHKAGTTSGSLPFMVELLLDNPDLTMHEAHFVPDTFGLKSHTGLTYVVGATLEVIPEDTTADDIRFVDVYGRFGPNWRNKANRFDKFINVDLPYYQRDI